eukprot:TRINITY_DN6832_c1_g1_i1.p1 TRINITY_DN6832_c1_g1~~TRINITY_DN6832_c1_g1_i1.p1  ORF type:complete len:167 (-),score=7.89 TRINITY_DN6832_c1_g1_i1:404-904(-)
MVYTSDKLKGTGTVRFVHLTGYQDTLFLYFLSQFSSLSDQLYRTPDYYAEVREEIVAQLRRQPELYSQFVPDRYESYCRKMSRSFEWGDHVTLQATADLFGVQINVLTSFQEAGFLELKPKQLKSQRVLWLSFWAEVHYNSLYPQQEPPSERFDNKTWWSGNLGNA